MNKKIEKNKRTARVNWLRVVFIVQVLLSCATTHYTIISKNVPYVPIEALPNTIYTKEFAICMLIGVFIVLAVQLMVSDMPDGFDRSTSFDFAVFILLVCVWMLFETRFQMVLLRNQLSVRLGSFFSFALMPTSFLIFMHDYSTNSKKVFSVLSAASMFTFMLNYILLVAGDFAFPPTLPAFHVQLAVEMIVTFVCLCREVFKYKNKQLRAVTLALCCFCVLALCGLLAYYVGGEEVYLIFASIGLILLVLIVAIDLVSRSYSFVADAKAFTAIADYMPSGVFRARNDLRLTLLYANDNFYRFYGYKNAAEAIADGFLGANDRIPLYEANEAFERRKALFATGTYRYEAQTCERANDGSLVYMLNRLLYRPETDEIIASVLDITDRVAFEDELKVREEEYRIVSEQSNKYILRYDIKKMTITQSNRSAELLDVGSVIENVPDNPLLCKRIAAETQKEYFAFFAAMREGQSQGAASLKIIPANNGEARWYRFEFTTIFSEIGEPKYGIVSFYDNTQEREKDLAYQKWQQELTSIPPQMRALVEVNLSGDILERSDVALYGFEMMPDAFTGFNNRTEQLAMRVHPQERASFCALCNREFLLSEYKNGVYSHELIYRSKNEHNEYRWLKLSVQLVKYPDSEEVKAYVLITDIDEEYRRELLLRERSETDPLTGVLNRRMFIERSRAIISDSESASRHAFVMIDLDGFKNVNDTLGHSRGDELLASVSSSLRSLLREGDLVGRIGGDEFMVCIKDIPSEAIVEKRAELILHLIYRQLQAGLTISASIGISIFPRDGVSFEDLYQRADVAMYAAKRAGGNRSSSYNQEMDDAAATDDLTPFDVVESADDGDSLRFSSTNYDMAKVICEKLNVVSLRLDVANCYVEADSGFADYMASHCLPSELMDEKYLSVWVDERDLSDAVDMMLRLQALGDRSEELELRLKKVLGGSVRCRICLVAEKNISGATENVYASIRPLAEN